MTPSAPRRRRQPPLGRRAYTLIEVVLSTLVISTMLLAALQAVTASRIGMRAVGDRSRGMLLAQDLMAEILQQQYADPDYGPGTIGLGATEFTGTRSEFDDVDDYDDWKASPPQDKSGNLIGWAKLYERSVIVDWVNPGDPSTTAGSETGVKRITVTVKRGGGLVAELTTLRTDAWARSEPTGVGLGGPSSVVGAQNQPGGLQTGGQKSGQID